MKTVPCLRSQLAWPHPATPQLEPRGWESPVSGSIHSDGFPKQNGIQ